MPRGNSGRALTQAGWVRCIHPGQRLAGVAVGDLAAPPLRDGSFDAVLCLGNTFSLLSSRRAQTLAIAALTPLARPGGTLMLQGEDAAALVAEGPLVRMRRLSGEAKHVRVFERAGRRVRMFAGVVHDGAESRLETTLLLPTSAATVARIAEPLGLVPLQLPLAAPGGAVRRPGRCRSAFHDPDLED